MTKSTETRTVMKVSEVNATITFAALTSSHVDLSELYVVEETITESLDVINHEEREEMEELYSS